MKVGVAGRRVRARGRRGADAGGVPRRGAGGRRASSTARPARSSALAALRRRLRPQLRHLSGRDRRRARGQARRCATGTTSRGPGGPADARARCAGRPSTRRTSSPRRCTATASRTAVAGRRAADPARDRPRALRRRGRKRPRGACWLGSALHAGKGLLQAFEWAEANEPVDFWGALPFGRRSRARMRVKGPVPPDHVPDDPAAATERFVFLPTHAEPFGRAVVEAWAAGCELIVNRNVGALHWLEHPTALESAAARLLAAGRRRPCEAPAAHATRPGRRRATASRRRCSRRGSPSTPRSRSAPSRGSPDSPFDFGRPARSTRAAAAGWGNDIVRPHAERHFGSLRGGLVISLVDVFVLDPAVVARAERRRAGCRSTTTRRRPAVLGVLRRDRRGADRDDALRRRSGCARSSRSTSRTASPPTSSRRSRARRAPRRASRATRSSSASSPSTRARRRASRWPR